jgi:hypothetical protein
MGWHFIAGQLERDAKINFVSLTVSESHEKKSPATQDYGKEGQMAGRTIKTNLALRIKGWRAAVKSPRTPSELKPGLRRLIRETSARLRRRSEKTQRGAIND